MKKSGETAGFLFRKQEPGLRKARVLLYNISMQTPILLQPDYTPFQGYHQIKLPLEMEIMIPADDPVRLLSAFVEGMDRSLFLGTWNHICRINIMRLLQMQDMKAKKLMFFWIKTGRNPT